MKHIDKEYKMTVKDLFEVIDTKVSYPDITIIDDSNSGGVKSFKYPQDGITYVDEMLNRFGDRTIVQHGIVFDTNCIIIEVK